MSRQALMLFCLIMPFYLFAAPEIKTVIPDAGTENGDTKVKLEFKGMGAEVKPPFSLKIGYNFCLSVEAVFDNNGVLNGILAVTVRHDPGLYDAEFCAVNPDGSSFRLVKRNAFRFLTKEEEKAEEFASARSLIKEQNLKEGTLEWYKAEQANTPVRFKDFWDDLYTSKPNDSWEDYGKYVEFTLSAMAGYVTFVNLAGGGELASEAKWKSFALISGVSLLKEVLFGSGTSSDNHFCSKSLASGITGAAFGSFIITIPFR